MAKKGPKRLGHSLTFTPERLYTKFQKIWLIRLGENALQTNGRTDGRTDGTEIIGSSEKIPRANKKVGRYLLQFLNFTWGQMCDDNDDNNNDNAA